MGNTRHIYAEKGKDIQTLDPFVEMPRMRVSEVNRLNELIERDNAMPIVQADLDGYLAYGCPKCKTILPKDFESDNFCRKCGKRLNTRDIAL